MVLVLMLFACAKAAPPEGALGAPHPCAETVEEPDGRVVGRVDYVLDSQGRVTATVSRAGDRLLRRSTTEWTPQRSVERSGDHLGADQDSVFTVTRDFDAQGRVVRITRDGGLGSPVVVTQTWDGDRLVRTDTDFDGDGDPERWQVYTYHPDLVEERTYQAEEPEWTGLMRRTLEDGRTVLETTDHGDGGVPEAKTHFVYDARGRLVARRVEDGGGAHLGTYRYLYDCPPAEP